MIGYKIEEIPTCFGLLEIDELLETLSRLRATGMADDKVRSPRRHA